jgi:hypothetical protein
MISHQEKGVSAVPAAKSMGAYRRQTVAAISSTLAEFLIVGEFMDPLLFPDHVANMLVLCFGHETYQNIYRKIKLKY